MPASRALSSPAWPVPKPPSLPRTYRTKASPAPTAALVHASSKDHDDLASYLAHAAASGLSKTSPIYKGTVYEYTVIQALSRLGFTLTRTGRRSDLGIDLLGHWAVPSSPVPLRALVQCKAHRARPTPENVRGLEGAFSGAPAGWKGDGVLGFLVAREAATKGMREALVRSGWPLGFVKVGGAGDVQQLLWNHVAGSAGLEGIGVGVRYGDGGGGREIALTWNGWAIERVAPDEEAGGGSGGGEAKAGRGRKKSASNRPTRDAAAESKRGRGRARVGDAEIGASEARKRGRPATKEAEAPPVGRRKRRKEKEK